MEYSTQAKEVETQPKKDDLQELVVRAISGDVDAFEALYRKKLQLIYYYVYNFLGQNVDIDDIVQEISIKLYSNISKLRNPSMFSTWMYRIIENHCYRSLHFIKKRREEMPLVDDSGIDMDGELVERNVEFLPSEYMETQESRDLVLRVIGRQSKKAQQMLIMYYFDEMSNKDIAAAMDIKVQTVTGRLTKLRSKMKAELEREMRVTEREEYFDESPSQTVLGNIFASNVAMLFPASKMSACASTFHSAIASHAVTVGSVGATHSVAHGAVGIASVVSGKVAVLAVTGIAVVSGGTVLVASDAGREVLSDVFAKESVSATDESSAAAAAAAAQEVWQSSVIEFSTESGSAGHDNPISARLTLSGSTDGYKSCTYTITDSADALVASGEGLEVSAPFAFLKEKEKEGKYTICFEFISKEEDKISLERDFVIQE